MYNRDQKKEIYLEVKTFLEKQYLLWQMAEGRKKLGEFAVFLEVNQALLSRWMSGKALPTNDNVIKIANKFGDEIYNILGWKHPISRSNQESEILTQTADKPSLPEPGPREKQAPKRKRTVQQSTSTF